MDHRYYKLLVLVEEGSYSAAARKLRISQPAMTISIATLEKSIGKKLFIRKKPSVELSAEGKIVYATAKKINNDILNMKDALYRSDSITPTHVGFIDSIAHLLYSSSKNNIILNDIEAMVDNSRKIISDVASNQLEFGFITGQPTSLTGGIKIQKLNHELFVFVRKPSIDGTINKLVIDDWLAFNRASTSYHHFTKQFKKYGISAKAIFYSTSMDLLKEMAIAGNGTALLPKHFVQNEINEGILKIVGSIELYRPIWVVSKNGVPNLKMNSLVSQVNLDLLAKS